MGELESLSCTELLERLPPISKAPILEKLATLGLRKFREEYGIETPVYENGIVNHALLMNVVSREVDADYKWQAPFFDEHHLHWAKAKYNRANFDGDKTPGLFRDLPIHKLWVPRQFHDFTHVITIQPKVPSLEVMHDSVNHFRRAFHNYMLVNEAITLRELCQSGIPATFDPSRVNVPGTKKYFEIDTYESRREEFIAELEQNIELGLPIDLSVLSSLELARYGAVRESLPQIRRHLGEIVLAKRNNRRRARPVKLPIATGRAA